jgi:hypothetical protein
MGVDLKRKFPQVLAKQENEYSSLDVPNPGYEINTVALRQLI